MEQPSYTSRRSLLNRIIGVGFCGAVARIVVAKAETVSAPDGLSAPEPAQAARIIDGDTLQLSDGDTVRLAGIEAPKPDLAPGDPAMATLAEAAANALTTLIGDGGLSLSSDAARRDRYGRRLAQVFTTDGRWVQAALITQGQARVHGDPDNRLGLRRLMAIEAEARAARRGIWPHPAFAVRRADDRKLDRLAGSFQIIEGQVVAAATVKGIGYINFGADRHTDLTLVLKNPALDLDLGRGAPAMIDLAGLTARPIRCRGWLDLYDGPRIDIAYPEQIEVLAN